MTLHLHKASSESESSGSIEYLLLSDKVEGFELLPSGGFWILIMNTAYEISEVSTQVVLLKIMLKIRFIFLWLQDKMT